MKAVVLAAGKGTRMRPLTAEKPKALVEVGGKPLLSRCFETLLEHGVDELIVVVGYEGQQIRDAYGKQFEGTTIRYARQDEQNGVATAVLAAEEYVHGDFVVMEGDTIVDARNLETVLAKQRRDETAGCVLLQETSRQQAMRESICVLDDAGRVVETVEKPAVPPARTAVAGIYTFDERIFDACRFVAPSDRDEYELTDAIDVLVRGNHCVFGVPIQGAWFNVNTPETVSEAETYLSSESF